MNFVKGLAVFLLIILALISLYPVKFKKKQVLWIMLIPALSLPTYLTFEMSRVQTTPHDRALALATLTITLIMAIARWLLIAYMRFQKSQYNYEETPVIRERKVQVAASLLALLIGTFVCTRLW